jgi:anti-sigma-K factor RskA
VNCREAQDLIPIQAAGAAVAEESAPLHEHLEACPHCRELMGDFTEVAAHLAVAVAPTPVPAVLREALDKRLDEASRAGMKIARDGGATRGFWAIAAAIALLVATGISFYIQHLQKDEIHGLHQLLAFSEQQNRKIVAHESTVIAHWQNQAQTLQTRVRQADQIIDMLKAPHLQMASLVGAGKQTAATGRLFWDQHVKMWKFCAADLKPLGPDKTYELWWITPKSKKIPAGIFNVDHAGYAIFTPTVPGGMKLSHALTAAVTVEPAGGDLQPQGPVELIGKL